MSKSVELDSCKIAWVMIYRNATSSEVAEALEKANELGVPCFATQDVNGYGAITQNFMSCVDHRGAVLSVEHQQEMMETGDWRIVTIPL